MRVLIFHGYLLRGTGSNVYNASLAGALARFGHEVHLLCQDREAPELAPAGAPGSVTIHNPEIGGLLPVFVRDAYEGFEVRTFGELSDTELDAYIAANVAAVSELVCSLGGVDAALANHLVMAPVILARAGLRYALKIHGSDLSYTVLPDLERFRPYAEEAVGSANGILVGSAHIAARLRAAIDDPQTNAKVRLGPPGVDTELFAPIAPALRGERLRELGARVRLGEGGLVEKRPHSGRKSTNPPSSAWERDVGRAAAALDWFAAACGPRVIFVGKLIFSKGVDLLLAAWPLIHGANPGARLLVVGFGGDEQPLRDLWAALARGDVSAALAAAERDRPLRMLSALLADPPSGYAELARDAASSVAFSGRLEHAEVATPVAAADALLFPSTFPEAFGMVAAEAAAAQVLPVSSAHSGAGEVSRALAQSLPESARELVSFELDERAVSAIAARVNGWLALGSEERETAGRALRETVERRWSWEKVARAVLAASAGELAAIPAPGALETHETSSPTADRSRGRDQ